MGETADGFRERARFEADRYGTDPWVFVRELLQNARDAGAREVRFRVTTADGRVRLSCRDDGEGMTVEHARRFLFRLYASSKAGDREAAGRFGIGFWSVLRFEPDLIVVRSRPPGGEGWELRLDAKLETAGERALVMQPGTEVVLERPPRGDEPEARVIAAIHADARLLTCRDDPERPVEIFVNDEPAHGGVTLPSPSLRFEAPGLRGVVALGDEPRVEVFAHGLRVRTAAYLDELLLAEAAAPPSSFELPEGLLPRVVLDSDRLQVLMARGEARDDATLRRMVHLARRELDRLIRAELDLAAPVGWPSRCREHLVGALRRHRTLLVGVVVAAGVLAAAVLVGWIIPLRMPPAVTEAPPPAVSTLAAEPPRAPYRDLAARYPGPSVEALSAEAAVDLCYRPASAAPLFAVLRLHGLADDGSPLDEPESLTAAAPVDAPCEADCLEVDLVIAAAPGLLRVPAAVGHRVDATSIQLDGRELELLETAAGEPALRFDAAADGVLRYRSGPAPASPDGPDGSWPELPGQLVEALPTLELLPGAERVAAGEEVVRALVAYDASAETGRRLREARRAGATLFEAAIDVGRGDCDVQNALLAALLARTGLPAALAVGVVGDDGRARPGLHAWVEVLVDGSWQVADASLGSQAAPAGTVAPGGSPVPREKSPEAQREPGQPRAEIQVAGRGGSPTLARVAPAALLAFAAGLLALAIMWVVRRRRAPSRALEVDGSVDLARLLSGALARPEAYREAPALFERPLVPLIGDRTTSLRRAIEASGRGRLFRSDGGTPLARRVAGGGEPVVDASTPVGATVGELLGARDLDSWNDVIEHAETGPVVARAEAALRRLGSRWSLRVADGAPERVTVVDGRILGLGRGSRAVVVDRESELWRSVAAAADERPAWSSLLFADGVADALALEPVRRVRWLGRLAREAVEEGAGGGS